MSGTEFYVSAESKSTMDVANDGTSSQPWTLGYAAKGAEGRIHPGDTVRVLGGTYRSDLDFEITVSGTAADKITFKADSTEPVILDGALPEFTVSGNDAWVADGPLSPGHNVYKSVKAYDDQNVFYGGFLQVGGEWYSLAPHKSAGYLSSRNHVWDYPNPRYLGPGISQENGHLLIRLDNSQVEAQLGRPVAQIRDPDPRRHEIYLCKNNRFGLKISGSYLVIDGFQIDHFGGCFSMDTPGQTDITIRNCSGRPISFGARCGYVDGLTFDSCKFHAHMPGDTWWVAYDDIKYVDTKKPIPASEPVADHVRKFGLGLGYAHNVHIENCVLEDFFDGILAPTAEVAKDGTVRISAAHDVEVYNTTFAHIWDDAWQMAADLYQIDFHHNFCLGAGPSVNAPGTNRKNPRPGTIYIHHNVIDTTQYLVFWGRLGSPNEGSFESVPLSSHLGGTSVKGYTWPRKLYYNTIKTGNIQDKGHHYVGWSFANAKADHSQARHEVINNIFIVLDGRPGGRDFDATSRLEIYDGNVYWGYGDDAHPLDKYPWQRLHVIGRGGEEVLQNLVRTVAELRASPAFINSQAYYPPGWEHSGLSVDPGLDDHYRPQAESCQRGAVDLTHTGWPWTIKYECWRGAINPFLE